MSGIADRHKHILPVYRSRSMVAPHVLFGNCCCENTQSRNGIPGSFSSLFSSRSVHFTRLYTQHTSTTRPQLGRRRRNAEAAGLSTDHAALRPQQRHADHGGRVQNYSPISSDSWAPHVGAFSRRNSPFGTPKH